ncbi:MAG TPA: hypothetical protein VFT51_05025 [Bacillales bacterium]|nr:hypothetical protein [Bacillales bacterium]
MQTAVGLLATARKKQSHPAPVIEFYTSPLFRKSVKYALQSYKRFYFYNAKDGLLLPEQIMEPYNVSIKTFSLEEKKRWAESVVDDLKSYEAPDNVTVYLHGGFVYRKFLQPELKRYGFHYEVPLKGMGIGKQLAWYDRNLPSE